MISRKIIALTASASLSVSFLNTFSCLAADYSASDLFHLRDSLLGVSELTDSDDVNGDGKVNVFDMCALRRSFLTSKEFVTKSYPATEEYVKLTGRTLFSNDTDRKSVV